MAILTQLEDIKNTKSLLKNAINQLNGSEVITTSTPFADYKNFIKSQYKTYTVKIDTTNSNPETALTYMDDAVGMKSGYTNWKDTKLMQSIKPCLLKEDGTVNYYI